MATEWLERQYSASPGSKLQKGLVVSLPDAVSSFFSWPDCVEYYYPLFSEYLLGAQTCLSIPQSPRLMSSDCNLNDSNSTKVGEPGDWIAGGTGYQKLAGSASHKV